MIFTALGFAISSLHVVSWGQSFVWRGLGLYCFYAALT